MRSQTTKPSPKKGSPTKPSFKTNSSIKLKKKKSTPPKKVRTVVKKSLVKASKKSISNDNTSEKQDGSDAKQDSASSSKAAKSSTSRGNSPTKKNSKDKKETTKSPNTLPKKTITKKSVIVHPMPDKKVKLGVNKKNKNSEDVKYKLNSDFIKANSKFTKGKAINKKIPSSSTPLKKKPGKNLKICDEAQKETPKSETKCLNKNENSPHDNLKVLNTNVVLKTEEIEQHNISSKTDTKKIDTDADSITSSTGNVLSSTETLKSENERPLKFFTSTRTPRTVDIDVKCYKTAKGTLSVSERFLPIKCVEAKNQDSCKDKTDSNNLISQGPDVDVYTFTEKVDSPKSILSDFRSPVTKTVGRVRPIARVKGTIVDKKSDTEKKKYSPHRPIEEVVKQLKANKKTDETKPNQSLLSDPACNTVTKSGDIKVNEDYKPEPIVSKSYKMVARKSSIPGKPFSPIKFLDQDSQANSKVCSSKNANAKKIIINSKKKCIKNEISDDEIETSKFSFNTKSKVRHYSSSDDSISESNDEAKDSESDAPKNKPKNKKYKKITDSSRKKPSKELQELSKDSLIDLKDEPLGNEKPSKRRLKLLSMWNGPKKHRMASLNAIAKVHCLYENESRTHMELGLMKTVDRQVTPGSAKPSPTKKKESKNKESDSRESTSESEYERKDKSNMESSEDDSPPNTRKLRVVPGIRSAGKYWDPKSSTSSSEDSELDSKKKLLSPEKKKLPTKTAAKSDSDKPTPKMKKTSGVPVKKKRSRNEVVMDLKDMVVQKRMASLNATAILAASYEKRSPKSSKDDTTSDSCSDESFSQKSKNGVSSGVKSELKSEEPKEEKDESATNDKKQKVEVIVNQDTDVTITGVYSTHHHEGFCTVSGMQYRISSTSHTQTTATANCEEGCLREDGARYTPLSALSSMQPPADHAHGHTHPVTEIGGLGRRAGCSSAFTAPPQSSHHEPGKMSSSDLQVYQSIPPTSQFGYYQPAGPLIKENADAERALARYHPQPHYHAPVLQQYGPSYYPADLCYGRYYRPPGPYHHMPQAQPESQMVGVAGEPYPPPAQYYGGPPPCYQHSQRMPYIEYRGCPCPMNACPKNVIIGPATGKAPTGGGPADITSALAPPGGAFRSKVRAACALDAGVRTDTHGSGKDPPAASDVPHLRLLTNIGGASPKREPLDVQDNLRLASDTPGPPEVIGPPSPARGSVGACGPQPPIMAPRRARLGKAMARRTLTGEEPKHALTVPVRPRALAPEADDDVLAVSPPVCAPIDLSSSDETDRRATPLLDVKKENEGPPCAPPRKPDTLALREHNSTAHLADPAPPQEVTKATKRRYSKPKLEIELRDAELEEACKTNGIGEHVKLQKRRKVVPELNESRVEVLTSDKTSKKKTPKPKKVSGVQMEKKSVKRKNIERSLNVSSPKKSRKLDNTICTKKLSLSHENKIVPKPKTKSALVLDNLIRKNSVDRSDSKAFDSEDIINPAELFLPSTEHSTAKNILNINNNIVETNSENNGASPKTIAAVTQLIAKKLSNSKFAESFDNEEQLKGAPSKTKSPILIPTENVSLKLDENKDFIADLENKVKCAITLKADKNKSKQNKINTITDKLLSDAISEKRPKATESKAPEKSIQERPFGNESLLQNNNTLDKDLQNIEKIAVPTKIQMVDKPKPGKITKRSKLSIDKSEIKDKFNDKVAKLLVYKKPAIKTDEASLVVEEACSSPIPIKTPGRRPKRRRSLTTKRRRAPALIAPPLETLTPPRWSNGWKWDGESYVAKVYINNDSRLDKLARSWNRMIHESGDTVSRGDCVLLRASSARAQPFVARIAHLWQNPEDGEMMVSLVWYYRPEHTDLGRRDEDAPDEVFASRHRDANSVACIEDKCYVLTYNEYCRYRKRLKAAEQGISMQPCIVPPAPGSECTSSLYINDNKLPTTVSPELVLFCRKIYDFRSKKLQAPNK